MLHVAIITAAGVVIGALIAGGVTLITRGDPGKGTDVAELRKTLGSGASKLTAAIRALDEVNDRCAEAADEDIAPSGAPPGAEKEDKRAVEARRRLNAAARRSRKALDQVRSAGAQIHILLAADEDARKHYDATEADLRRGHTACTRKHVGELSVQKMTAALKDARADRAKYDDDAVELVGTRR